VMTDHGGTVVPRRRIVARGIVVTGHHGGWGVGARRGGKVKGGRGGFDHAPPAHARPHGPRRPPRAPCGGSAPLPQRHFPAQGSYGANGRYPHLLSMRINFFATALNCD